MTRLPRHYAAARGSYAGELVNAARDFSAAFRNSGLWSTLAWNDILSRYRGSVLGPFWITLTSAAFAIGVGIVYSHLTGTDTGTYVRWMAISVVLWNMIAITTQEGCDSFNASGALIRQTSIPLPVFSLRTVLRNLIVFLHQAVIIVAVSLYFRLPNGVPYLLHFNMPMFLLGFLIMTLNITWVVILVGIISTRFRDFPQVVVTGLQLAFFISPVIWMPKDMHAASSLLIYNPITHLLEITRAPLFGGPINLESYVSMTIMAVVGWLVTFAIFASVRRRLVHYL